MIVVAGIATRQCRRAIGRRVCFGTLCRLVFVGFLVLGFEVTKKKRRGEDVVECVLLVEMNFILKKKISFKVQNKPQRYGKKSGKLNGSFCRLSSR
jgi:hypothetical protein